ncbi:MAG: Mu transposase C-terminal domain-containing protein [Methylococcaceae bacterium]
MSTINGPFDNAHGRPATLEEIAKVMGKGMTTIERWAKKESWKYSELPGKGRHKKRLYALKDLPKAIADALYTKRLNQETHHEKNRTNTCLPADPHNHRGGDERATTNRNTGHGDAVNGVPDRLSNEYIRQSGGEDATLGLQRIRGVEDAKRAATLPGTETVGRGTDERNVAKKTAGNAGINLPGQQFHRKPLAANGARKAGRDLAPAHSGGLPGTIEPIKPVHNAKQRLKDDARHAILQFVERYHGGLKAACDYLTVAYAAGEVSIDLKHAIENCNDKVNENRLGKVSFSTVGKWQRLKKETGSCMPEKTRDKTRWQDVYWLRLFLAFYRKPQKPRVTEAYAEFKKTWAANGLSEEELPSIDAVRRIMKDIPLVTLEAGRRTGSEMAALKAFTRRDWGNVSNQYWVGDGHSFKAKVRHPENWSKAFAPEVTVVIDAASRFIVGWAFSLAENQLAVSEAIGQGMIRHGIPLFYYSDNGSGQTAKTLDCPIGGMLGRLGVEHATGRPGNPQGRGIIEGMWDITTIAVAKTYPTFQGTGMDDGALRKVTNAINSAKRKGEVPDFVPEWAQFIKDCEARFNWYNTKHKHSSLGGKTPGEVYHANFVDEGWARRLTEEEELRLFRPSVTRQPRRGEVNFDKKIYFHQALAELPGKTKVLVAFDFHDPSQVWVSDLKGQFICIAELDGNKSDAFAKSYAKGISDKRYDGIEKRSLEKIDDARIERDGIIEGEVVLQRIDVIPQEIVAPLIRVPVIPKETEVPLKSMVIEGNFNKQEPEEKVMTAQETTLMIAKLMADKKAAEE